MKLKELSSLKQYDYLVSCLQKINYDSESDIDPLNLKCFIFYTLNSNPQYQSLDYTALDQQMRSLSSELDVIRIKSDISIDLVYTNNRMVFIHFFYRSKETSALNIDTEVSQKFLHVPMNDFIDVFSYCYIIMRIIDVTIKIFQETREFKKGQFGKKINILDDIKDSHRIVKEVLSNPYCDKDMYLKKY